MSEVEPWRLETAYHEAGHVVALYALGLDLGDASIAADLDSVGRVGTPVPEVLADRMDVLEYSDDGREYAKRQIVVAFAGVAAVEVLTGGPPSVISPDTEPQWPGSDYSRLNVYLLMLAAPEGYQEVYDEAQARTNRVLRANWNAVRAVAEALLGAPGGELGAVAVRSVLEEAGCTRDDVPVRRLLLSVERDRLIARLLELMEEVAGLEERTRSIDGELEALRREERA